MAENKFVADEAVYAAGSNSIQDIVNSVRGVAGSVQGAAVAFAMHVQGGAGDAIQVSCTNGIDALNKVCGQLEEHGANTKTANNKFVAENEASRSTVLSLGDINLPTGNVNV